MKRDVIDTLVDVAFALVAFLSIIGISLMLVGMYGCTHRIDMTPERVEETSQRVHDLQHHCDRCGAPATTNVSEVADEQWWRCPKCLPDERPYKLKAKKPRTFRRRKLETQIAKG